jgi:hypothetical protein
MNHDTYRERLLVQALRNTLRKAGVLNEDTDPKPPELLLAAETYTGVRLGLETGYEIRVERWRAVKEEWQEGVEFIVNPLRGTGDLSAPPARVATVTKMLQMVQHFATRMEDQIERTGGKRAEA